MKENDPEERQSQLSERYEQDMKSLLRSALFELLFGCRWNGRRVDLGLCFVNHQHRLEMPKRLIPYAGETTEYA